MKKLISVNSKFMVLSPEKLVEIILDYDIDGFEIFNNGIDSYSYLEKLAYECKKHNKIFQIHASSDTDIEKQIAFFKKLEFVSDMLGYPINVVLHPIYNEDKNKSLIDTANYLNALADNCDMNKIVITLENLNDMYNLDRLNKNDIIPIICNNDRVYFTYDIGHEIIDGGNITDLNPEVLPLIKNVHMHTNNFKYDYGYDHKPIFKGDDHWNNIIKGILFLKSFNYNGPVVFEYDVYALPGDNFNEKLINYCKSIQFIGERL